MYVLITGATGFIGKALVPSLLEKGYKPLILTRRPKVAKQLFGQGCQVIVDLNQIKPQVKIVGVINLAGAPIDKRWSKRYKKKLMESRIGTTQALIDCMQRLEEKPEWMISGSAIGFYGASGDQALTEASSAHPGFTHTLCQDWESVALQAQKLGTRVCLLRTGVVLGAHGGALKRMLTPFKLGLGGRIGSGLQWFSWIALEDMVRIILFLIETPKIQGAVNATAPYPVCNKEFTKALGSVLKRPTLFPMPGWVVKLLFGEMGIQLLLKGQKVMPQVLLSHGFEFKYPKVKEALSQAIRGTT